MRPGAPALLIAVVLFVVFFADVAAGAFAQASLLDDVSEMLMLLAATIAFVIGVLIRETVAKSGDRP